MDLSQLQDYVETQGFDLFGQMRWIGDTIWLPCGDYLPKTPEDIGIVFTIETAEPIHRSCGMFVLDANFLVGGRLGTAQTTWTVPLDAFRRRSGPRDIWEHEEILGQ